MTTFAILGSGFGLYGYLPALVEKGVQYILLPERYRTRFFGRSELIKFAENVQWETDEESALNHAEGVVFALRPSDQSMWIAQCLERSNIKWMILEKPLAPSPEAAAKMFEILTYSRKVFRIGYIFRYTAWGKQMLSNSAPGEAGVNLLSIEWSFLAHHFRNKLNNWKRYNATGGGALRFYGIQIIALLAEIGYCKVTSSHVFGTTSDEIEKWVAVFEGSGLPKCEVLVDTKAIENKFQIEQSFNMNNASKVMTIVNQSDPFDEKNDGNHMLTIDRRIPLLSQLYQSLYEKSAVYYEYYDATIKLWSITEEETKFEVTDVSG